MIKVTVGKKVITTGMATVSVRDFGAVGDGDPDFQFLGTDDTAAFQAAIDSLPATGGEVRVPGKGIYVLRAEVFVNKPNIHITMDPASIVNIWGIAGTGTPDVHSTVNVLAGFKVTADNCSFTGGRITGRGGSDGKNVCAVLVAGVNNFTGSYITIDGLYTSIWAGGGAENLKLAYLELDGMSHNLMMGYQDNQISTTAPQLNKAIILGIRSKNSVNDGLKLTAFADQIQIIGGYYHNNGKDGIDTFVSGEFVSISGVHCIDNTVKGIDIKFGGNESPFPLTPTYGINRNVMVHNCVIRGSVNNSGLEVNATTEFWDESDRIDGISIIGCIAENNKQQGFQISMRRAILIGNIARNNGSRGYQFRSSHDMIVMGNISDRNCQLGQSEGFVFQKGDGPSPPKTFRIAVIGNQAIGSGTAIGQRIGFDMPDVNQGDMRYIGNNATNNFTKNYNMNNPYTTDLRMRDNRGHNTENAGLSAAISSGGTIAHELQFAPDTVSVIPNGSGPTGVSVASNGTNLTITFSGGGSHQFYWSAKTSVSN